MSTSIEARQARVNMAALANVTSARLIAIDDHGLLFEGDLTDEEVGDIWWHVTSADATDQTARESIAAKVTDAEAGTHGSGWLTDAYAELARYVARLGDI